jgi:hypothetical protein
VGAADCIAGHSRLERHDHDQPDHRGRGVSNLWNLWGALPHKSHAEIFFGPRTFEYFSRIKEFKEPRALALGAERRSFKELDLEGYTRARPAHRFSGIYFPARVSGGAGQISANRCPGPRGSNARISAKFRKLFFNQVQCGLGNARAGTLQSLGPR